MERIPPHDLNAEELLALVLRLQERLEVLEVSNREQTQWIERQAKRIAELEKEVHQLRQNNSTLRLEEAYSLRADEQRREAAQQGGVPSANNKQRSERRGVLIQIASWRWPRGTRTSGRATICAATVGCGIRRSGVADY